MLAEFEHTRNVDNVLAVAVDSEACTISLPYLWRTDAAQVQAWEKTEKGNDG